MKKTSIIIPILITTFSIVINIVYVIEMRKSPLFYFPQMDALYHFEWAKSIISGEFIGKEVYFRAPLYPYLLALLLKITEENLLFTRIIQSFLGSFSVLLIYFVAYRFFSRNVAIFSAIVASVYGPFIYFNAELLIVPLILLLDLLIILLLFSAVKKTSSFRWLTVGFITGLSALARPNILLPALFLPVFLFFFFRKNLLKISVSFFAGVIIIISPVLLRNYMVGKDFVPIASQGGINFYIGNNPLSDGTTAIAPGTRGTWWGGYDDAIKIAERETSRELKPSEISNYWLKKGLNFIITSPLSALKLMLKKSAFFFSGMEIINNKDIYFFKRYSNILNVLVWRVLIKIPQNAKIPFFIFGFPFSFLFPFSILGILFSLTSRKKEQIFLIFFLGTYYISVVIFFVNARYRIPVIPILIILATYGFVEIIRRKKPIYLILPLSLFILFSINVWKLDPPGQAQSFYNVGIAYGKAHRFEKALQYYEKAIKENPLHFETYVNIGNIYARFNMNTEAEKMFKTSLKINPFHAKAHFNLGHLYLKNKELTSAYKCYEKAFSLDPNYYLAYFYAGVVKEKMGDIEKAKTFYKKTLSINRDFEPAKSKLKRLRND
jgi:tetratricopeptide (TPR) repeat protein